MGLIAVDQLKEGMALAADVADVNTRLLLSKGSIIESKHIRMFKMWGIGEVDIQGDVSVDADTASGEDPDYLEQVARQTKTLFRYNNLSDPIIQHLFALAVVHRSKNGHFQSSESADVVPKAAIESSAVIDVRARIKKRDIKLPEIPTIVYELNEVIADPFTSADDIAQVVSKSPSLASLLLRMVNSAFYGFPSKIDRITRAVALIGSREISSLALGITTMRLFNDIPGEIIDVKAFFKHSLACGILSRILAAHLNFSQTEQLFVAGLLHDIGRVLVFKYFPSETMAMLTCAQASGRLLFEVEYEWLRCRHTHVGRDLFRKWKLPYRLENCTYWHHTPSKAQDPNQAAVVHLADICVHGMGLGASGEHVVPPLDKAAVEPLHLSPSILKNALHQTLHQLEYLQASFAEVD